MEPSSARSHYYATAHRVHMSGLDNDSNLRAKEMTSAINKTSQNDPSEYNMFHQTRNTPQTTLHKQFSKLQFE